MAALRLNEIALLLSSLRPPRLCRWLMLSTADVATMEATGVAPASVHRDLISYAEVLARQSDRSLRDSAKLIAPMVARFYGNGPRLPEIAKNGLASLECLSAVDLTQLRPPVSMVGGSQAAVRSLLEPSFSGRQKLWRHS